MKPSLQALQPLGRALMLPIAVLPIAGMLLRLGQPDLFNVAFVSAAGSAIFDNLGLLFALGIGVGLARDNNGAAGLAGAVCFLVAIRGAETLLTVPADTVAGLAKDSADLASDAWRTKAIAKLSVPIGLLSGVAAGTLYNRYATLKLPDYLAFFGGRRFVSILAGVVGLVLAAAVGIAYGPINSGMDGLSRLVIGSGVAGLFIYGVLNRLLLVTGLHHILNNVAWFIVGDYHGTTGDLKRFFAGDPSAGAFMSGFFPVMMFGLPAACLAMYHTARPERRAAVGGMLASLALTALLTGVTEPIEFSFMFLAPLLYSLHAVMTGLAMVLADALGMRLGFSFSAGLFDYVINFGKATRPLLLLPLGAAYFALYYGVFRFAIVRFDLKTPGRETENEVAPLAAHLPSRGRAFVEALGGAGNLERIDACTTRLRLVVQKQEAVDTTALKALGARGFIRPSERDLQVVVGPIADEVAREMREAAGGAGIVSAAAEPRSAAVVSYTLEDEHLAAVLAPALGGPANLLGVDSAANRVLLTLSDPALVDETALARLGLRGVARPRPTSAQVMLDHPAAGVAAAISALA